MAISFEQLQEIVAKSTVLITEIAENQKVFQKELAESRRDMAESREEFQRELAENRKEFRRELAESQKRTDLALQETQRTLKQTIEELSGNISGVNRRLGEIVEMVVLPSLMKKMNGLNHNFTMSSPQKRFSKDGEQFAEIDLLLENCDEVMAVEAKARFKLGDMNRFLERIKLLRENEDITGTAGKTIYAAAAAIGFDKNAREFARKLGMYLIDIDQDNDNIKVTQPPKGKIGKW